MGGIVIFAQTVRETIYIYHITHIRNLASILREGGLWCDREAGERGLVSTSIAHQHIKQRRAQRHVPCGPGGTLADYVPFYFAPRSPMLYAIHRGNVEGYTEGQEPILHLVSSVQTVVQAGLSFVFTDGHAEMAISRFFTNLEDLQEVDWKIMRARYWYDTFEDGDRKRRRQAEFLVHNFFPWELVHEIGVYNRKIAQQVETLIKQANHRPIIIVRRFWYY